MSDIVYLTLSGEFQGNISTGCGTQKSVGNRYQLGHEDQIFIFSLMQSTTSTGAGANHLGIRFCKTLDKSSPLLSNAINNNESLNMVFDIYRVNRYGRMEKYYVIEVRGARLNSIQFQMQENTLDYEYISADYDYIRCCHLAAGTEFDHLVTPENYQRLFPPAPVLPEPKPPEEPVVRRVTLVLGIFFDGTGNNAVNTGNMLAACSAEHFDIESLDAESIVKRNVSEKMGISGTGATSHSGYYTNIHWLSELYLRAVSDNGDYLQYAIYIEGIGTKAGKPDSVIGMGLGVAGSGVISKTDDAVGRLTAEIATSLRLLKGNYVIDDLLFDIFGFSRGAAAARHFANRIQPEDGAIVNAIKVGMEGYTYSGAPAGKTRFIGIFDTVAAIGTPTNGLNPHSADTGGVNLSLRPGVAQKVFHITAQHECRYNFALNSISPAWPELSLPGVHSDIGGGYLPQTREDLFLTRPLVETLPADQPKGRSRVYRQTIAQLPILERSATIAPLIRTNNITPEVWEDEFAPNDRYGQMQKRSFAALTLRQRIVKHDWSMVTLRVMIDAAKEAGVLFDDVERKKGTELPAALDDFCQKAIAMGKAARTKAPTPQFSPEEIDIIAELYTHCSANWNAVAVNQDGNITGGAAVSESVSFVNRPDEEWIRTVYNMDGVKQ
ncbi:type VI secretion system tube protein TssD [Kluyvera sp. CHPC 1.2972]|uniref:type VI secretion system tube protein TssD n=1 Tax=Kluyvera sp. CHPC 1.2972 TaxID=2995176 RepID=UPI002FD7A150